MKCKSPFNFALSKWTQGAFYQTVYTEFLKRVPSALDAVGVDGHQQREAVKGEPGEGGWQNADSSNSVWQIFLFNFIKQVHVTHFLKLYKKKIMDAILQGMANYAAKPMDFL